MTNGKFDSLAEFDQYLQLFRNSGISVPVDWYNQAAVLETGGRPQPTVKSPTFKPVSIYDYKKNNTPYSLDLQRCIEDTVKHLFKPLNPSEDTSVPGLLLGRIQSGKTRAFVGVMALAFDKGIDACIVLTKPDDGLVQQTKARMMDEFSHFCNTSNIISSNVIQVYDVNSQITLDPMQLLYKNIFVLHKNKRLEYMKNLLDTCYVGKKVLVIDDEADFISRTFYSKQKQITGGVTGFRIDELTNNPKIDCYYLQVTATPYSLLLQPTETIDVKNGTLSCFHPRFTVLVPTGTGYIGGKQYQEESINPSSIYSCLFKPIDDECFDYMLKKKADVRITGRPDVHIKFEGLRTALMNYFVSSSIRKIQEEKNGTAYRTSMLIHCATEKNDHTHQRNIVNIILKAWENHIINGNFSAIQNIFDNAYNDCINSINIGQASGVLSNTLYMPSKTETQQEIEQLFGKRLYSLKCINGDNKYDPNLYTNKGQLKLTSQHNIFISGFKADRGITIDGLISFVYGRRPQSGGSANTILQHMRQYGYRSMEDMSVTRFYTTINLHHKLTDIYYTDETLRSFFSKNAQPEIVCMEKDRNSNYALCSPNQVRMSDMRGFDSFGRIIATEGMQTVGGCSSYVNFVKNNIQSRQRKEKAPFLVDKNDAIKWIKLIRQTFKYAKGLEEWDECVMISAIEKYSHSDGKIWCYYRLNRNTSRMHNGIFSNAPEDGKTDTPIAIANAKDRPFLMFMFENGLKSNGWNDQPFIWPVLRLPQNISPSIYCYGVKNAVVKTKASIQVTVVNTSVIIKEPSISQTMIKCITLAGPAKVEGIGITFRKQNLVYTAGRKPKDFDTIVSGKYYIRKGIPAVKAKEFLEMISINLNLKWQIDIV